MGGYLTDFHTHVLPAMDDGSASVKQSLEMLEKLAAQGVGRVCATSHFVADYESVDEFLRRRADSFAKLSPQLTDLHPQIALGAEIKYYDGISRLDGLEKLKLQGSSLLLVEMPSMPWGECAVRELEELASNGKWNLLLAHVERSLHLQPADTAARLKQAGALMQMNAEAFAGFFSARKGLMLIKNNLVQFIGSDCHGTVSRVPNINLAFDYLRKKLGEEFVFDMAAYWDSFFTE